MQEEPKHYKIRSIKRGEDWNNSYGEYATFALALEGVGEPVKLNKTKPLNFEPAAGDVLYGRLIEEHAKDGRLYWKLKCEPEPDNRRDSTAIQAQWAIGQAVNVYLAGEPNKEAYDNIEREAKHFYSMINRVREG